MPVETRVALLTDIRANWEFMCRKKVAAVPATGEPGDKDKTDFGAYWAQLPLLWNCCDEHGVETDHVRWLSVCGVSGP